MRLKILSKRILFVVVFVGFTFFLVIFFYFLPKSSIQNSLAMSVSNIAISPKLKQINSDLPIRLKIPKINVNAVITQVGLTNLGAMGVPKGPNEAAWLNLGPRPGEIGSAVIAGHKGWKNNIPAVFDNLHQLRPGDKISIENEKGMIITFVVREIRIYGRAEIVPKVFGSNDGKAHLNLITCTGDWNKKAKTSSSRLVVFSDLE